VFHFVRRSTPKAVLLYGMGLQPFCGKQSHPLLWAGLQDAHGKNNSKWHT